MSDDIGSRPVSIRGIKILGAHRTRVSTIEHELQGVYDAATLGEAYACMQEAHQMFSAFGIFKRMNMHLAATDEPGVAELLVEVEETSVPKAKAQVSLEGASLAADIQGTFLNALGLAEAVTVEMTLGASGARNLRAAWRQPHAGGLAATFTTEVFESAVNLQSSCGCTSRTLGANLTVQPDFSRHRFQFGLSKRDLLPSFSHPLGTFANASSEMLRQVMDPSIKSSLQHVYTWLAPQGWPWSSSRIASDGEVVAGEAHQQRRDRLQVKVTNEVAGLGGDVCFLKSQVETSTSHILSKPYWGTPGLECRTKILAGLLYPMGTDSGYVVFNELGYVRE